MINATPALKLYAKYRRNRLERQNPAEAQTKQLLSLVRQAAGTHFGTDHDFKGIKSVADFQARVPLRSYEKMWNDYWKASFPVLENVSWPGTIPYFAVSSGTSSGTTKYIPYTDEMTASNTQGGLDLLTHHLSARPDSQIFAGRSFILGGSTDLMKQAPGIYSGDLSGIAVKTMRWWASQRYFPPKELCALKNWEEKIQIFSEKSLEADIRMISGVPSWLLIFFERLQKLKQSSAPKISNWYPELDLLVHGGVNFSPYIKRFEELLKGSRAEMREVYPASEGFIAVADRKFGEGLRLILDHGIFFEFVPLEELGSDKPTRHWVGNVEPGINYAIILSTCAGLWSYVIGDTVRFTDTITPRVLVTGRTSYYLSAFGEHIIAEELEDAVSTAASSINASVTDYSVGPVYPEKDGELGGHIYIVEFSSRAPSGEELEKFRKAVDRRLCERNEDYEAHRAKGFGLRDPEVICVKPGTFADWMKSRGKFGGQNKVPRIIMDRALLSNLVEFSRK